MNPSEAQTVAATALSQPSAWCLAQAWVQSYFELSSVFCTTCIAAMVYRLVVRDRTGQIKPLTIIIVLQILALCNGAPIIFTALPAIFKGAYGYSGAWCWITEKYAWLQFVQFYIPLVVALIGNAYLYWKVRSVCVIAPKVAAFDPVSLSGPQAYFSHPQANARQCCKKCKEGCMVPTYTRFCTYILNCTRASWCE